MVLAIILLHNFQIPRALQINYRLYCWNSEITRWKMISLLSYVHEFSPTISFQVSKSKLNFTVRYIKSVYKTNNRRKRRATDAAFTISTTYFLQNWRWLVGDSLENKLKVGLKLVKSAFQSDRKQRKQLWRVTETQT